VLNFSQPLPSGRGSERVLAFTTSYYSETVHVGQTIAFVVCRRGQRRTR